MLRVQPCPGLRPGPRHPPRPGGAGPPQRPPPMSHHPHALALRPPGARRGRWRPALATNRPPPLRAGACGPTWFGPGGPALYFRPPTPDGELVQAFVERPPPGDRDAQVRAWMPTAGGALVGEGTASV